MSNPLGLNEADMRRLISSAKQEASNIRSAISSVNSTLDATWWKGHDADTFRETWRSVDRRRLEQAATELDRLARNAGQALVAQQQASK